MVLTTCILPAYWKGSKVARPSKPTNLKVLHGDRADRIPNAEPQPGSAAVEPPARFAWVDAEELWCRLAPDLVAKGVLTAWDVDLFFEFCHAVALVRSHRPTKSSVAVPGAASPMGDYKTAVAIMTTLGSRFGLTPADRAKIEVGGEDSHAGDDLLTG